MILVIPEITTGDNAKAFRPADGIENLPVSFRRQKIKRCRDRATLDPTANLALHLANFIALGLVAIVSFDLFLLRLDNRGIAIHGQIRRHGVSRFHRIRVIGRSAFQRKAVNARGIRMIGIAGHPAFQFGIA